MSCCVYYDDADEPQFCRVTEIQCAHKDHECSECRATIPKGDSYRLIVGKWDRMFIDTYKHCDRCAGMWDALSEVDCPLYGGLWDVYEAWKDATCPPVMNTHWTRLGPKNWTSKSLLED